MSQGTAGIAFLGQECNRRRYVGAGSELDHASAIDSSSGGIVTDVTGAVVSSATIQVHNTSTGEERTVVTDAAGAYVLPSLPLGSYRVSASSSGMQTMIANNVILEVGRTAEQNFTLRVAASAETIEVTGIAPSISTESLATNAVIDAQTVQRQLGGAAARTRFLFVQQRRGAGGRSQFHVERHQSERSE